MVLQTLLDMAQLPRHHAPCSWLVSFSHSPEWHHLSNQLRWRPTWYHHTTQWMGQICRYCHKMTIPCGWVDSLPGYAPACTWAQEHPRLSRIISASQLKDLPWLCSCAQLQATSLILLAFLPILTKLVNLYLNLCLTLSVVLVHLFLIWPSTSNIAFTTMIPKRRMSSVFYSCHRHLIFFY